MFEQRKLFRAASLFVCIAAAGCQHAAAPLSPSPAAATPQHAVVTSMGNGGSATFFFPGSDGGKPVVYCSAGTEVCPDCEAAAEKYFKTGVLDSKCSRTGMTRTVMTPVAPSFIRN